MSKKIKIGEGPSFYETEVIDDTSFMMIVTNINEKGEKTVRKLRFYSLSKMFDKIEKRLRASN